MSDGNEDWAIALQIVLRGYEKRNTPRTRFLPSPSDVCTDVRAELSKMKGES